MVRPLCQAAAIATGLAETKNSLIQDILMRAEIEGVVDEIKQAISLLRRHL